MKKTSLILSIKKNSTISKISIVLVLLSFIGFWAGCNVEENYYDHAINVCNHRVNKFKNLSGQAVTAVPVFDQYPECKEYLQSLIHFNENSFMKASPWIKDKFLESLQVLIAYPLQFPPEDRVFGVSPWSFSASMKDVLQSQESINKSLFNFILSFFDEVFYDDNPTNPPVAEFGFYVTSSGVTLFNKFFLETPDQFYNYIPPWRRAAVLAHESWHGTSQFHVQCPAKEGFNCDNSLNGAYGFEILYASMLLHGSFQLKEPDGSFYLSNDDVVFLETLVCVLLKNRILDDAKSTVLKDKLASIADCHALTYADVLKIENLSR